jgi:hypothetical protein
MANAPIGDHLADHFKAAAQASELMTDGRAVERLLARVRVQVAELRQLESQRAEPRELDQRKLRIAQLQKSSRRLRARQRERRARGSVMTGHEAGTASKRASVYRVVHRRAGGDAHPRRGEISSDAIRPEDLDDGAR